MEHTVQIQAPLPHIGSVNIWLLHGAPLTLIDTGPRSDEALSALEAGLGREGLRIEITRDSSPRSWPAQGRGSRRLIGPPTMARAITSAPRAIAPSHAS